MLFARTRIPVASSRPLSARSAVPFTPACVPAPRPSPCQLQRSVRCLVAEQTPAAAAAGVALKDAELQPIMHQGELQLHKMADVAGVYAVFDKEGQLQYIGLSRKIDASIANHMQELPDLTSAVKFMAVADASKDNLVAAWKSWVEQAVEMTGNIPPGNAPGETRWQARRVAPLKKEIRLTAGKPISGITMEQLIDRVVKDNKVVAFVKGTRTQPQCGFSYKMLQLLNESKADFEVVNVLDDVHNPGLRDAIKTYSQWPTIPQLYVKGEFVGGADICEQMFNAGELQEMLSKP